MRQRENNLQNFGVVCKSQNKIKLHFLLRPGFVESKALTVTKQKNFKPTYPAPWKAGTARRITTQQQPMYMTGFAFRNRPGQKIMFDFQLNVLVDEDTSGQRAPFASGFNISFRTVMAQMAAEGVEFTNINVNASGSMHSVQYDVIVELDGVYYDIVVNCTITALLTKVIREFQPAIVSWTY